MFRIKKLAFFLVLQAVSRFYHVLPFFPSFRFSSFISLRKWGIKGGRRHACAPPAYLKLPFSLPTGEGRGGAPYLTTTFFPPCIYTPLGNYSTILNSA
jgi:hypothetical protein